MGRFLLILSGKMCIIFIYNKENEIDFINYLPRAKEKGEKICIR